MEDDVFDLIDELAQKEPRQAHRQYSITQPQFKLPAQPQPVARRDRYRAPARREDVYDITEEDELLMDSFDDRLMQQSYEDRQKRAERGHARLSFPPKPNTHLGPSTFSQPVPAQARQQKFQQYGEQAERHVQPMRDLSQFAYNAPPPLETSSDPHYPATSSPAFEASQRRAEIYQATTAHASRRPPLVPSPEIEYQNPEPSQQQKFNRTVSKNVSQRPAPSRPEPSHEPPVVQGIPLVPVTQLPDRMRAVFPFPTFNAVQSKCFDQVYKSNDNFVLASPTGSGKTAILELAICRAFSDNVAGQYKIIYQAPIKALCSERQRDWHKKFTPLGLTCVELTGDSDAANLPQVQAADIIVTTPEKWDSITRKWKDHEKLIRMIKLFLIDEVHILKEDRGAILEAVVSRMKTTGTDVRFVALSATIPNLGDVAAWIGKNSAEPFISASSEKFGEEFRPVKVQKHVCGYPGSYNDFQLENLLDKKLPEVISKYSQRKPIMVFCMTRASTSKTAKILADWWSSTSQERRFWKGPSRTIGIQTPELRNLISCGVAFHHAGLDTPDRIAVENGFLDGDINVICCTSTLAVGINLPCHFVIIKNTVTWSNAGIQEYSDLEVMQMIGRAGRPQFDDSSIAVIMTRQAKVRRYETMVTGQEVLESRLHVGLVEHLNAEVGLGTIRDLPSARNWLSRTFLYVRLKQNPAYYKLEGSRSGQDLDEQLDDICLRDLNLLQDTNLVTDDQRFKCTAFGEAMARYYVSFETMKIFVGLQQRTQISEILSALSQAAEFKDFRFRSGEKPMYKALNSSASIRFPIPVNLDLPAHKVSLIIQSALGGADIAWDNDASKNHKFQYQHETAAVFKHIHRLIRCIADCQISLGDSVAVTNALLVQRSLSAQAWDDGPLHMKQIPAIGIVAVRKLVNADIRTVEELEFTDAHRLDMILGRNPPFGLKLLDTVKTFPKPRVSVHVSPKSTKPTTDGVKIQLKVEIGFLNETPPLVWQNRGIYVCLLAETSDGQMIHFARISAKKLGKGQDLVIPALMKAANQSINCYVMCDEIAGTMRMASVKPDIAPSMFPATKPSAPKAVPSRTERPASNTSKRRTENFTPARKRSGESEEFDDGLDDEDLVHASLGDLEFDHIENYANPTQALTRQNTAKNTSRRDQGKAITRTTPLEEDDGDDGDGPRQLENGKWACNHKCKDKTACKHGSCCREGLDKPPKKCVKKPAVVNEPASQFSSRKELAKAPDKKTQTKLQLTASKRKISSDIQELDLTQPEKKRQPDFSKNGPRDYRNLHQLHKNVQKKDPPASISSITHKKPKYCYSAGGEHNLSFLDDGSNAQRVSTGKSSDYGDLEFDDLPTGTKELDAGRSRHEESQSRNPVARDINNDPAGEGFADHVSDLFGDDDSVLGEAMVGLADSQDIRAADENKNEDPYAYGGSQKDLDPYAYDEPREQDPYAFDDDFGIDYGDDFPAEFIKGDLPAKVVEISSDTTDSPAPVKGHTARDETKSLFFNNTSSPAVYCTAKSLLSRPALEELKQAKSGAGLSVTKAKTAGPMVGEKVNVNVNNENLEPTKMDNEMVQEPEVPDAFKDLEPWLYAEFGDIIELVDE